MRGKRKVGDSYCSTSTHIMAFGLRIGERKTERVTLGCDGYDLSCEVRSSSGPIAPLGVKKARPHACLISNLRANIPTTFEVPRHRSLRYQNFPQRKMRGLPLGLLVGSSVLQSPERRYDRLMSALRHLSGPGLEFGGSATSGKSSIRSG